MVQRDSHEAFDQPTFCSGSYRSSASVQVEISGGQTLIENGARRRRVKEKAKMVSKATTKAKRTSAEIVSEARGLKAATLMDVRSASRCGMASRCDGKCDRVGCTRAAKCDGVHKRADCSKMVSE